MRNQPIQHATILALAGLCGVLFLQTSIRADVVDPGFNLLTTDPTTSIGGVNWAGDPLGMYNFGGSNGVLNVGLTDTIVQREGTSGDGQMVPAQINAMQLESTTASFGGQYGFFTLDPNYTSGGTMTINADGTYTTEFSIYYDIHIGSLSGPITGNGELTDMAGSGTWSHTASPSQLTIPGVNYDLNDIDTSSNFVWPPDEEPVLFHGQTDTIVQRMTSTPEPGTLTLLGLGLAAVGVRIRRRRQ